MKDIVKLLAKEGGELFIVAALIAIIVVLNAVFVVSQSLLITVSILLFLDRAFKRWVDYQKNRSIERCLHGRDIKECANFVKKV